MVIKQSLSFLSSMAISNVKSINKNAKIIILEGNISAGKTFLSTRLGELLNYKVFLEPTTTNPYLQSFYENPKKYALDMQLWLLNQRFKTYLLALEYSLVNDSGVVLDRSVFSDWVFAENCRKEGLISSDGFTQYTTIRNKMISQIPIPNITVYLDVTPEQCLNRIQTLRKREFEQSIPLSYLQGLDGCYKSFLEEIKSKGSNVVTVDWSKFAEIDTIIKEIKNDRSLPLSEKYLNLINFDDIKQSNGMKNYLVEELNYLNKETNNSSSSSSSNNTFTKV
ncbi:deoxyguanosine kinase [Heterostelium album PN500]|uniref:Deoxyguanosine kinase n=1 Tax=Heterostelium pallidum (strain ATCC 26659 / Pp 5 / PN500) TaxID=670386 RepID=D3AWK0_HETP5|nr:deoxyguanosine kinase [Heterostelium album PN500]EFA86673.1 deoxyguanosine kinase [Heterostelium album PN500]|eukprot:XP_020438777.1 deoxyguanosine kinase [Heterostelium album PN500]